MRAFAFMLAAMTCTAQESPLAAILTLPDTSLRALHGVEGAWHVRTLVPSGVLASGFDGTTLWYETAAGRRVIQLPSSGAPAGEPAPDQIGEGLFLLRQDGATLAFRPGGEPFLIPLAETTTFQLFLRTPGGEEAVSPPLTLPSTAPQTTSSVALRIRNPTASAVTISRLSVDPGAFQTFDQFFPPHVIPPLGFADFSVRFSPGAEGEYSSTLHINDFTVALRASTAAAPSVDLDTPAGWQPLRFDTVNDLGTVERQATLQRRIRIIPSALPTMSGEGFRLQPGPDSTLFDTFYTSDKSGIATGVLGVAGRSYPLRVTVTDFPAPHAALSLEGGGGPARQEKLLIRLAEPARAALSGTLTLRFTPETGLPDDPAIAFLPSMVRTLPLHIAEGASQAEAAFQTGSTAGQIAFTAAIGGQVAEYSFRILPEPVALSAAKASAAAGSAEVVLTGFDTSRSASRVAFTFYLRSGQTASPGRVEADVSAAFQAFYKTSTGGAFLLRAGFPVAGTISELESVEVEMLNSQGVRRTGRLRFE